MRLKARANAYAACATYSDFGGRGLRHALHCRSRWRSRGRVGGVAPSRRRCATAYKSWRNLTGQTGLMPVITFLHALDLNHQPGADEGSALSATPRVDASQSDNRACRHCT